MRIAVWHNLPSGGGKRALHQQVQSLLNAGHYLESWCPPSASQQYLPLGEMIKEHIVERFGDKPTRLGKLMNIAHGMPTMLASLERHCRRCAQEMEQGGFDLLFANATPDVAVPPIGKYFKGAKVLSLPEPNRGLYEARPTLVWAARPSLGWRGLLPGALHAAYKDTYAVRACRVLAREEQASATVFDQIIVNSYYSRDVIQRVYGLVSAVCYLGIDTEKFVNQCLPRKRQVIGVGEVNPRKGVDFLIRALGAIPEHRPPLVWIANKVDSDYLAKVQSLADRLDVVFELRVSVPDSQLIEALNQSEVFVYSPMLEPFGLALLEASSCGVPVVAVAEAGVRETVEHNVTGLLAPREAQAFGAAIDRLLQDQALARRLGDQGAARTRELFSLAAADQRFVSLIESVKPLSQDQRDTTLLS